MATSSDETSLATTGEQRSGPAKSGWLSSSSPSDTGRIPLGTVLAERYRVIGLLGRGGMGEVYRADDLRLGQPVALKFLPDAVRDDPVRLAQFHTEVRIARQVSHRNVCRVYDIGEADGRVFLSMEYVDGEDLATLLRRIGRLPQDKGVEISRQICAGLSAAHEQGVLHRDLKPANVMLDGDGRARVTDFGLAGLAGEIKDIQSGTPAYMAPEQLAGRGVSVRSDLFSLGLILYEIFTGRRAFDAKTVAELLRQHDRGLPETATSAVRDLDPAIEGVIERCLSPDPAGRPASALAVSAALPGGDPLAAALAAGETPSPEMVAAAGSNEALAVWKGLGTLAFVAAAFLLIIYGSTFISFAHRIPLDKPAAVLEDRAREVSSALGYRETPLDSAGGFTYSIDYARWVRTTQTGPDRWSALSSGRPPTVLYWYRTSPRLLEPAVSTAWPGSTNDPPLTITGMTVAILDTRGRLVEFHAVPAQRDPADGTAAPAPDWRPLFRLAELPEAAFAPATPAWTPRSYSDTRAAWVGRIPELGSAEVRVEAAAYRGRVTFFGVVGPWSRASRMEPAAVDATQRMFGVAAGIVVTTMLVAAGLIARRHLVLGRGDRVGANRVAMVIVAVAFVSWGFEAKHFPDFGIEQNRMFQAFAEALFPGALFWGAYMALEPWVRRHWPSGLIGWSRALARGFRDPLVGRDVLVGIAFGAALASHAYTWALGRMWATGQPPDPVLNQFSGLAGMRFLASDVGEVVTNALINSVFFILVYVVLRRLVRIRLVAAAGVVLLITMFMGGEGAFRGNTSWVDIVSTISFPLILVTALLRFGLLTLAIVFFTNQMLQRVMWTSNVTAWYAAPMVVTMAAIAGLAVFAFVQSRAGAPLFGRSLMAE
jgi:serine/threonine-protein kinase